MDMKLVDSEIKVMDVLWKEGDSMAAGGSAGDDGPGGG